MPRRRPDLHTDTKPNARDKSANEHASQHPDCLSDCHEIPDEGVYGHTVEHGYGCPNGGSSHTYFRPADTDPDTKA